MDREERRWRIVMVIAVIVGPIVAVVVSSLFWPQPPPPSPQLMYIIYEDDCLGERGVYITIGNFGNAPSESISGWIDFPSDEKLSRVYGHSDFEVKVGDEWKPIEGTLTDLEFQSSRVFFRAARVQPGTYYPLSFYTDGDDIDLTRQATVTVVDDTGPARKGDVLDFMHPLREKTEAPF